MSTEPQSAKLGAMIKLPVTAFFRGIVRVLRAIYMGIDPGLHWALGDRPGAYAMFFLWIALILAAWNAFTHIENTLVAGADWMTWTPKFALVVFLPLVAAVACVRWIDVRLAVRSPVQRIGLLLLVGLAGAAVSYWIFTNLIAGRLIPPTVLTLPLAIVAACIHRVSTRAASLSRARKIGLLALGLAGAAAIYWMQTLSGISQLLGTADAPVVSNAVPVIWDFVFLLGALALLIDCRWILPVSWRALAIGQIGGCILAILLSDPVITWAYNAFVPGGLTVGAAHNASTLVSLAIAALLALAIGPLTVYWARPSTRRGRLALGALAGALAGLVLFVTLGGPTAGFIGASPLFAVAQTRLGFNAAEWTLKLGQTVNMSILLTLGAVWLFLIAGGLVGALTALLIPTRIGAETEEPGTAVPVLPMIVLLTTIPLMGVTLVCIAILSLLGASMENLVGAFGFTTGWRPGWTGLIASYQPWLILTGFQIAGLFWLFRFRTSPYVRALAIAACMSGLVNLLWIPFVLGSVGGVFGWINAALGLETLIVGVRLYRQNSTFSRFGSRAWVVAWVWGFVIAMVFGQVLVSTSLNLTQIQVSMIVEMAKPSTPPPGLPWLQEILSPVYSVHSLILGLVVPLGWLLMMIVTIGLNVVALYGLSIWLWIATIIALTVIGLPGLTPQQAFRWTRQRLGGVVMTIYRRIAPGHGRFWLRSAIWLAAGLVLDAIPQAGISTAIAGLVVVESLVIERVPVVVVALAFLLTLVGSLVVWMGMPVTGLLASCVYALLAMSAFLALRALMAYTPERWRSAARLTVLIGFVLIGALFGYLRQSPLSTRGGVSRYDGQSWQVFTPENSSLGVNVAYRFYADSQRNLWFGGNKGVAVRQEAGKWTLYLVHSTSTDDPNDLSLTNRDLLLADAGQGKLWTAFGGMFAQFDLASDGEVHYPFVVPTRNLTAAEATSPQRDKLGKALLCAPGDIEQWAAPLPTGTLAEGMPTPVVAINPKTGAAEKVFQCSLTAGTVTDMAQDKRGGTWLATAGNGAIHLDPGSDVNQANWQTYSAERGQLVSNTVNTLFIDTADVVWFGTDHGLSRFDGTTWKNVPGMNDQNVNTLFVDSRGGVWTGTRSGAQCLEEETWRPIVKDVPVTAFAEGQDGSIWIGTPTGLIRYSRQSASQTVFNVQNSGMAANAVRDLVVDKQGGLWVSTFEAEQSTRSPLPAIVLNVAFIGGLLVFTYRGYRQSRATGMGRMDGQ